MLSFISFETLLGYSCLAFVLYLTARALTATIAISQARDAESNNHWPLITLLAIAAITVFVVSWQWIQLIPTVTIALVSFAILPLFLANHIARKLPQETA